jgi:hypothetical protein
VAVANSILKQTGDEGKAIASGLSAAKNKGKKLMTKAVDDNDEDISLVFKANASDYAYVPDPELTSTWKLNISDSRHTAAAVAALGKGFRGQKVSIPEKDLPAVKRKVATAYRKFFPSNDVPPILKALDVKVNDQEVADPGLLGHIINSIASYFRCKEYDDQYQQQNQDYAEEQLVEAGMIQKSCNEELRQATFVVLEADKIDLHGDIYSAEEVAKGCHNFNEFCRKAYIDHAVETEKGKIVESYVAPADLTIGDTQISKGTWLAVMQFDEELWQDVKKNKFNGLSIGAYAKQEDVE